MELKKRYQNWKKKVVDYLNSNAKDLYEKNKAEYQQQMKNLIDEYWGDNPRIETHKKKMWNPPDTYLDAQSILTDELIRIGHKDRTFSMEEFLESNSDIDELFVFDQ